MEDRPRLPIGIDDFKQLRQRGCYFVDKTLWIEKVLSTGIMSCLITRPRRFGKTLNMTMLREFLDINGDPRLFEGTKIAENKEFCEQYQNKFPVIFLSLKSVNANSFNTAYKLLCDLINGQAERYSYLLKADKLSEGEKSTLKSLMANNLDENLVMNSLLKLSELLRKHYDKDVIILIDEYDVPLDKAFHHGYYDEMIAVIRGMLGNALKTNPHLYTSALTGALRVSKESIFTGLNHFGVDSITDTRYSEFFGFTENDVKKLLADCGLSEDYGEIAEWYDGYRFGNIDVYNPWSVLNRSNALMDNPAAMPEGYWANTSGNDKLHTFIDMADEATREQIESLVAGQTILKKIRKELTYADLYNDSENLWSVLFLTGYLTLCGIEGDKYRLRIPNREVLGIYKDVILEWFKDKVVENGDLARMICQSIVNDDPATIERHLNAFLRRSISVNDNRVAINKKENFYHGMLLTFLSLGAKWDVRSNVEAGDGFADLIVESEDLVNGYVIELKYAKDEASLAKTCEDAMAQVDEKRYVDRLIYDGIEHGSVWCVAFHKKRCKLATKRLEYSVTW